MTDFEAEYIENEAIMIFENFAIVSKACDERLHQAIKFKDYAIDFIQKKEPCVYFDPAISFNSVIIFILLNVIHKKTYESFLNTSLSLHSILKMFSYVVSQL